MCLIDVPNVKEIKPQEGYFYVVQKFFKSSAKKNKKKKNVKKIGQFLKVHILFTTNTISFKFDMLGHMCVEHKICKCDKNSLSISQDTRAVE